MNVENNAVEIQFRLHARVAGAGARTEAPPSGSGSLPRVAQVLALAIHFQDMIQRREARDYADLARLGCLTRERMSQVMELVWLAPDIQQKILEFRTTSGARFPISEVAVRKIASALSWKDQREAWKELQARHHLI
ncbi:MAG TPA: hypothetical protein VGG72_30020 [Bryobacteraceae bacterium]|jgi:hypothetical protein